MDAVVEIELVCLDPEPEKVPVERQHWVLEATVNGAEWEWSIALWGV